MTDINKLKQIAAKLFPSMISNTTGGVFTTYPSPAEVMISDPFPSNMERVEILMHMPYQSTSLHTNNITYGGKAYHPHVIPAILEMPENCFVCDRTAVDQGVIESSKPLYSVSSKLQLNSPNAGRLWTSLQSDRYWFTFPVCQNHKNDFIKNIWINVNRIDGNAELKLSNPTWSDQFIKMNDVKHAVYKSEEYLRKYKWSMYLLFFGILSSAIAITATIVNGSWGWLIPTLGMLIGGIVLLFTNRYEVLVSDTSAKDGKQKPKWYEGIVSLRQIVGGIETVGAVVAVLGLILATMKTDGKYLPWPWYIKIGIIALGVLIFVLGSWWRSKIEKKK
jgi:hypothetical protein